MEIKLFEVQNKNIPNLENLVAKNYETSETTFNEVMKLVNVSLSIENQSRLGSHIVCESLDSYTQQSQRYVVINADGFMIPEEIKHTKHKAKFENIVMECFELYNEMTQEVEGKKRGRGAKDSNHKYGIPIEDGRYIIPLAAKTNVFVTMPGNKIVNFYRNLINQPQLELQKLGEIFAKNIEEKLGEKVATKMEHFARHNIMLKGFVNEAYKEVFEKIDKNVVLLDRFEKPIHRAALGGLTSTNPNPASEVYAKWEPENKIVQVMDKLTKDPILLKRFIKHVDNKYDELINKLPKEYQNVVKISKEDIMQKEYINWATGFDPDIRAEGIANKILGYGHESISEHDRSIYGSEQSLTSYHQFERHRLPENHRESFENIPTQREVYVPPKIKKSKEMYPRFMEMVEKVKNYRQELIDEGMQEAASYLLLNADGVKVITSSNARIDKQMLAQRTCTNAQWEIRDRANQIVDTLREGMPFIYNRAGPECTKSKCPEGALSCGKTSEMRDKWGYFGK